MVTPAGPAKAQTMLAERDVESSSHFYRHLLGLVSGQGGPDYERLLASDELVLQLCAADVEHHERFREPETPVGNGVLVWFGEVSDFDGVVGRADQLGAPVDRPRTGTRPQARATDPPTGRSGCGTRTATPWS